MNREKKQARSSGLGASGPLPSEGESAVGADEGARLEGLVAGMFDSINLKGLLEDGDWPSSLPENYLCIAPRQQAMIIRHFSGDDESHAEEVFAHVRHCGHCSKTVMDLTARGDEVSKENYLHLGSRDGLGAERSHSHDHLPGFMQHREAGVETMAEAREVETNLRTPASSGSEL